MELHHQVWFSLGLFSGVAALYLGRLWSDLRYFIGRRRTEARLHEEGKRRLLLARDKVKAELQAEGRLQTNGSTFSERSKKPSATDGNTHGR